MSRFRVVLAVLVLCGSPFVIPVPASAATTSRLYNIQFYGGDQFYNYDFNGTPYNSTNVDWKIDLIFYNNAEIDKVKSALYSRYPYDQNGTKDAYVNDGYGFGADFDRGKKQSPCPPTYTWYRHYRVYAPNGTDTMYTTGGWGFYVIGTQHYDINDGCPYPAAGYSEIADGWMVGDARAAFGYSGVFEDYLYLWNEEPSYRVETSDGRDHHWDQSEGAATCVYVT